MQKDIILPENDNGENGECAQYFRDAARTSRLLRQQELTRDDIELGLRLGNMLWWAVNGTPRKEVVQ